MLQLETCFEINYIPVEIPRWGEFVFYDGITMVLYRASERELINMIRTPPDQSAKFIFQNLLLEVCVTPLTDLILKGNIRAKTVTLILRICKLK